MRKQIAKLFRKDKFIRFISDGQNNIYLTEYFCKKCGEKVSKNQRKKHYKICNLRN